MQGFNALSAGRRVQPMSELQSVAQFICYAAYLLAKIELDVADAQGLLPGVELFL